MATQKDKESRGFEYPKGTGERLEAARKRHGHRSINALLWFEVLEPWLDEDEAAASLGVTPAREKRKAAKP